MIGKEATLFLIFIHGIGFYPFRMVIIKVE